jgi:hypothetical protein
VAVLPFTVTAIGSFATAVIVVEKCIVVVLLRQMPESSGMLIATRMLSVLEAVPTGVAVVVIVVQASGASTAPVIVCTPFLKESRSATTGIVVVASFGANLSTTSVVCGAVIKKPMKMTQASIEAAIQRRV